MRYIIVGAGSIGGVIAARLAQNSPDHPPLVIARGDNADAIAADGIRFLTPDEDSSVRVDVARTAGEVALAVDDVLVFATKTHQVEQALLEWVDAPVHDADGTAIGTAGELLPAFMALNGVASERIALRLFARVYGVCVWLPAVHLAPGEVVLRIAPTSGVFTIGRYGGSGDDAAMLATLADDWRRSSFGINLVPDVMRWKYAKLIGNLGNAVQALVGPDADSGDVVDALRDEGRATLDSAGIAWASPEEESVSRGDVFRIRPVAGLDEAVGGSSWQSLRRGTGSIETDYLNGEIVYIAREHGAAAPANAAVQLASRQAAAARTPAGSMPVDELRSLITAARRRAPGGA